MEMKNNIYKPIAYTILLIFLFFSCKKNNNQLDLKPDNKYIISNNPSVYDSIGIENRSELANFKVKKLSDKQYIISTGDTLMIKEPDLKFFEGKIDGKKTQLWLRKTIALGEEVNLSEYSYKGTWYMEGDKYLSDISFESKLEVEAGTVYSHESDVAQRIRLFSILYTPSNNTIVVKNKDQSFILPQSDILLKAHDKLVYENCYCSENNRLVAHWSYQYSYIQDIFEKVKVRLPQIQDKSIYDPNDISKWKHEIVEDVMKDDDNDSGSCFRSYDQSFIVPMFLDSTIFIISHDQYIDMGGAHGMFRSEYYNFDIKSGKQLYLDDVLDLDNPKLDSYILERLNDEYYSDNNSITSEMLENPSSFYIIPSGLCLIYPPYSLGGGFWEKELFLLFEEIEPFLNKQYYN